MRSLQICITAIRRLTVMAICTLPKTTTIRSVKLMCQEKLQLLPELNVKQDDYKSMIKFQKEAIALSIQFLESPHNGFKKAKIQRALLKSIR
jgi:hypothetical protein